VAIVGKTPLDIQNQLDRLLEYCNAWGLSVNTAKTKIMVFRKRGGLLTTERWTYNSQHIDVVNEFNYLGTVLSYPANFGPNIEHVVGKSPASLNNLL